MFLYAHLIAPASFRQRLPRIDQDWKCFGHSTGGGDQREWMREPREARAGRKAWERQSRRDGQGTDDPSVFLRFVQSIATEHQGAGPGRGSLHFIHVTFPHTPWRFTPSAWVCFPAKSEPGRAQ